MLDVCVVLAHEFTAAWIRKREAGQKVTLDDLPFRQHVGDLFDLARRAVLPSINTLMIRRGPDGDSIFLHGAGPDRWPCRRPGARDPGGCLSAVGDRGVEHGPADTRDR